MNRYSTRPVKPQHRNAGCQLFILYFCCVENLPLKQLIKTALFTAPMIAVTYCTPMYIFKAVPFGFFTLLPLFTVPILIAWFLNIFLLAKVKAPWTRTYIRTIIISLFMFGFSGVMIYVINPPIKLDSSYVTMVRIVNILSINSIIYVLIDLTLTKENKNKIELENANLKIVKLEADYKLLKDQINPHFLFNALSTAKSLIKPQPELAEEYIIRLSDFLRASINNNKKTITLNEELQLCTDFVALNKIRFGKALNFETDLPADAGAGFVPHFALLSLIENAIKHNAFTLESPLNISISIQQDMLEVRNNRKEKFIMETSTGTGLNNLNERYKLVSGKEIIVNESSGYYSVKIPVLKN